MSALLPASGSRATSRGVIHTARIRGYTPWQRYESSAALEPTFATVPPRNRANFGFAALVSRFRSSQAFAAISERTSGSKAALEKGGQARNHHRAGGHEEQRAPEQGEDPVEDQAYDPDREGQCLLPHASLIQPQLIPQPVPERLADLKIEVADIDHEEDREQERCIEPVLLRRRFRD